MRNSSFDYIAYDKIYLRIKIKNMYPYSFYKIINSITFAV